MRGGGARPAGRRGRPVHALLLAAILAGGGGGPARVAGVVITQDVYSMLVMHYPVQPPGGPFVATGPSDAPPRELHWTFEGLDYDNLEHQTVTAQARKDHQSCAGEYSRCILRENSAYEACAMDYWTNYYYKFHSICDIEFANCFAVNQWYPHVDKADFRHNRYIYDGEGWVHPTYHGGWWKALWGEHRWHCYEQDAQYNDGWRRSAAPALAALQAAKHAAVSRIKELLK